MKPRPCTTLRVRCRVSIEDILENYWEEMNAPEASRPVVQDEGSLASFYMLTETFLEQLHAMGELAFVQGVYGGDWIRRFFNGRQYRCALFLLGLVDFLCRKNQIRKDVRYEEYRKVRWTSRYMLCTRSKRPNAAD